MGSAQERQLPCSYTLWVVMSPAMTPCMQMSFISEQVEAMKADPKLQEQARVICEQMGSMMADPTF